MLKTVLQSRGFLHNSINKFFKIETPRWCSVYSDNTSGTFTHHKSVDRDNLATNLLWDSEKSAKSANGWKPVEDCLFDVFRESNEKLSIKKFLLAIEDTGLRLNDQRLQHSINCFKVIQEQAYDSSGQSVPVDFIDRQTFKECVADNIVLLGRAFQNKFVIPEFKNFSQEIDKIFWDCKDVTKGKIADYIPQLSRMKADQWGLAICTVDGQRHSIGDTGIPICFQSCSKPMNYALALDDLGEQMVHEYIGQEPSGVSFNELALNTNDKPHNPMVNSGAIVICSLLKNDYRLADRFEFINNQYKELAGGEYIGFNNSVFLSERETADRNFALGYYMKEKKCFPEGNNLMETLDLYFQLCSVDSTCDSGSVIAATLANGGVCPITGERVLHSHSVRNTLSLMHSCGMYDYSGQFAFKVGLPAKSGVSGMIMLVVPNVMGVCMWSPPLDKTGNSYRGLQFCKQLVSTFNFHNYDNLRYTPKKMDPRRQSVTGRAHQVVKLLFSSYNGDITAIRRYAVLGLDLNQSDYDSRTALHVAAAEGHYEVVEFLLEKCGVTCDPKDRWGFTPADDAKRFNHENVATLIAKYHKKRYPVTDGEQNEEQRKEKGSDSEVNEMQSPK